MTTRPSEMSVFTCCPGSPSGRRPSLSARVTHNLLALQQHSQALWDDGLGGQYSRHQDCQAPSGTVNCRSQKLPGGHTHPDVKCPAGKLASSSQVGWVPKTSYSASQEGANRLLGSWCPAYRTVLGIKGFDAMYARGNCALIHSFF